MKKEKQDKLGGIRIPIPRPGVFFKNKKTYSRKVKHKIKEKEDG